VHSLAEHLFFIRLFKVHSKQPLACLSLACGREWKVPCL
jgi:hypothetical protein